MNLNLRHIIIVLGSIVLVGCAMESKSPKSKDMEAAEIELPGLMNEKVMSFINEELIGQKLNEFYDLLTLQQEHPDFNDEVKKQLQNYTSDPISNFGSDNTGTIDNIRPLGKLTKLSDDAYKLKFAYDKMVNNTKVSDTIYAIINTKTIVIDGTPMVSNKIRFTKD